VNSKAVGFCWAARRVAFDRPGTEGGAQCRQPRAPPGGPRRAAARAAAGPGRHPAARRAHATPRGVGFRPLRAALFACAVSATAPQGPCSQRAGPGDETAACQSRGRTSSAPCPVWRTSKSSADKPTPQTVADDQREHPENWSHQPFGLRLQVGEGSLIGTPAHVLVVSNGVMSVARFHRTGSTKPSIEESGRQQSRHGSPGRARPTVRGTGRVRRSSHPTSDLPISGCLPRQSRHVSLHDDVSGSLREIDHEALTPVRLAPTFTSREPVRWSVFGRLVHRKNRTGSTFFGEESP